MRQINRTSFLSILILFPVLLMGCKKDEPNTLTINPDKIDFPQIGGSSTLTITTNAESWKISNPASDWLVLSKTNGTEKTSTVTASVTTTSSTPRIDTLTITAGDAKPVKVIVSQPATAVQYSLTASVATLSYERAESSNQISITTDAPQWTVSSNADWVQFSQTTGNSGTSTFEIKAKENLDTEKR